MIEAVIYDFHGTLADTRAILSLIAQRKYDEFYEASLACPPNEGVVLAARHSARAGYSNLLLTGMPERYRDGLGEWLKRYEVPVSLLLMRRPEDGFKKDFIVKKRMYDVLLSQGYHVVKAWEDSPAVVDLWERQAVPVEKMPWTPLDREVDKPNVSS